MRLGLILFYLILGQFALAEDDTSAWPRVMVPLGDIPAGSEVTLRPLGKDDLIFKQKSVDGDVRVRLEDKEKYYQVKRVKVPTDAPPDTDEFNLNSSVQTGDILVSNETLTSTGARCVDENGMKVCQTTQVTPTYWNSPYQPAAFQQAYSNYGAGVVTPYASAAPVATPDPSSTGINSQAPMALAMAGLPALVGMIESMNKKGSSGHPGSQARSAGPHTHNENCEHGHGSSSGGGPAPETTIPAGPTPSLPHRGSGGPPSCAVKLAQEARNKAGDRVKSDVMIVIDNSRGRLPGDMWFVKTDGTLADVGVPNPIPVAFGRGFGTGCGTNRSPEGAMVTHRTPHVGGRIRDGVGLSGLEPLNSRDLAYGCRGRSRGVLIHGWYPNSKTQGCFGINGTLKSRLAPNGVMQGPDYYDRLKRNLFFKGEGRVLVYNYSPSRAAQCGSSQVAAR